VAVQLVGVELNTTIIHQHATRRDRPCDRQRSQRPTAGRNSVWRDPAAATNSPFRRCPVSHLWTPGRQQGPTWRPREMRHYADVSWRSPSHIPARV